MRGLAVDDIPQRQRLRAENHSDFRRMHEIAVAPPWPNYLAFNGSIEQLTHDDSWAATVLAQDPKVDPGEIAHHPMRNVLTNVLGAREQVDIHVVERDLHGGEVMLLCSDGLHGVLDGAALKAILSETSDVERAARTLVSTAIERGSRDNVTALVVRYEADR